jgi:RimJ/RimL family protein N-acetyltransferase
LGLVIETDRLRVREYEDGDAADILEYSLSEDFWVRRNVGWEVSEEGVRAYWDGQRGFDPARDPKWFSFVVELKSLAKVVGNIGVGVVNTDGFRQGSVGWLLGRRYQGRGLATEAVGALMSYCFHRLGFHRISARTGHDNTRSWQLMERLGMRREAHFLESHVVNGEWRDEYVYAVLAEEWRGRPD